MALMEKVILAFDSYKGCLSSREANAAAEETFAGTETLSVEMSDGGEGMLAAFVGAMGGKFVRVTAHDALMRTIDSSYGVCGDTAIVEVASTIGLQLIEPEQRNPIRTVSWGVGEQIMDAYRHGIRRFIVGLGGSATSDCGIGMLRAMGDDWHLVARDCHFTLASDVVNPLFGPNGAARVFAPQKGADATMTDYLDSRARRFADASRRALQRDFSNAPGAGAAGGLGYAFMQYFGATAKPGADLLLDTIGFDNLLDRCSLVVTGEGHSDAQTLMGKLPMRILNRARKHGVDVWLVSGGVTDRDALLEAGFSRVMAVTPDGMSLAEAMRPETARANIRRTLISCGSNNL